MVFVKIGCFLKLLKVNRPTKTMVLISTSARPVSTVSILIRSAMMVIACMALVANSLSDPRVVTQRIPFIFALLVCVACFFIIKLQMRPVASSVYDCGDYLSVSVGDRNFHITLSNIKDIRHQFWISPGRVTLTLINPGILGSTISFVPRFSLNSLLGKCAIADELRDRSRAARHTHAAH
jgi:hypothetical protein